MLSNNTNVYSKNNYHTFLPLDNKIQKIISKALLQNSFFFKTDTLEFSLGFYVVVFFLYFPLASSPFTLFFLLENIWNPIRGCGWETFFPKPKVTSHLPPRDYNILIKPYSNKLDPPKSNFFEEVFYLSTILGGRSHTADEGQKIRGVIGC